MAGVNVPVSVLAKRGRALHNQANHPLEIMKRHVQAYFATTGIAFEHFDSLPDAVSISDNFDKLLTPADHPARSNSDTYYLDASTVLRTHTTAHQNALLADGRRSFLVTGDVYRKDEVNSTHYPVFHQMEGVAEVPEGQDPAEFLVELLSGLVKWLFPGCQYRVSDDYFPFTTPSFEVKVQYRSDWLEILGCGVVHPRILANNGIDVPLVAWGLGLERLCMILFEIPDIRMFWDTNDKFIAQFASGLPSTKFKPYSMLDLVARDISFWLPADRVTMDGSGSVDWEDLNSFYEHVSEVSGDAVQSVELYDKFFHGKKQLHSHTFRVVYAPTSDLRDPAAITLQANELMSKLAASVDLLFGVSLR